MHFYWKTPSIRFLNKWKVCLVFQSFHIQSNCELPTKEMFKKPRVSQKSVSVYFSSYLNLFSFFCISGSAESFRSITNKLQSTSFQRVLYFFLLSFSSSVSVNFLLVLLINWYNFKYFNWICVLEEFEMPLSCYFFIFLCG